MTLTAISADAVSYSDQQPKCRGVSDEIVGDASLKHQQWRRDLIKTLCIMKIVAVLMLAVCLHVSAESFSQTITLSEQNAPLEKVLNEIKKQSGYELLYNTRMLKNAPPVTIDLKQVTVEYALKKCLENQPFAFTIVENTIVIKLKDSRQSQPADTVKKPSLLPDRTITARGIVYNEAGQPLSGANVTIKSTGKGTITNAKGEFELMAVNEQATLIISFIGYTAQEVKVTEGRTLQMYLNVAKNELDKVVVRAYGTTTQRLTTGNIATVTAAEIERQPVMNPLLAIEGKVPGVVVTQASAYASAPVRIEIRGRSVINPNLVSEPLYIIDGVPLTQLNFGDDNYQSGATGINQGFRGPAGGQSPFFSVNPTDIESITVLKDADATAIYGSRGADGVIIINTKKGKAGKAKVNMHVYTGESKVTQHYKLLNTQQYLSMRREAFKNDAIEPSQGDAYDLLMWDTTRYTDWQKFLWGGTGKSIDAQMAVSGGEKNTIYRISGDYHRETSILSYSGADQRGAVQFNLNYKSLNQRFGMSFTSLYSYTQSDLISIGSSVLLPPNAPAVFDKDGQLNWAGWAPITSTLSTFSNLLSPYTAKTSFLNSSVKLSYDIFKGLSLSSTLGYSTTNSSQVQINPIKSQNPQYNPTGSSNFGNSYNSNWIIEPNMTYSITLGRNKINFLFGGSAQHVAQGSNLTHGTGYVNDDLLRSIGNAPVTTSSDGSGEYNYNAVFSQLTYNFSDKYILNLSARRDGSSRFGPGKQFGNFGAIGGAWIFTEETWVKNHISFLSFGKIRGSYGITGRDLIGDYGYLTRWSAENSYPYQSSASYAPLQHANPDLQWEVNKKFEAAINLGFLKDRINVGAAWYRNRCGNQLLDQILPIMTGFSTVATNLNAVVQNKGIEGTLQIKAIQKQDMELSINLSFGAGRNKLIAFPNLSQSSYAGRFVIGRSLSLSKMFHYIGVDPISGDYKVQDRNKDGQITYSNSLNIPDDTYFHDLAIKLDGGFATDFRYKNWQLNLYFHFRRSEIASYISNGVPGFINNQPIEVLDHWKNPGDKAKNPKYTTQIINNSYSNFGNSDGSYSDGSFIRLQNVSVSYGFPKALLMKLGMQDVSIYARAQNLFVLTKYNGIDPESPDVGGLPPAKMVTIGIQAGF